eukprot:11694098-Heterocapsa_arctica.AAC.1
MGRALRAEPVAVKRKPGRPLGTTKKKMRRSGAEDDDEYVYLDEQIGGAGGSAGAREAKRPEGWGDD